MYELVKKKIQLYRQYFVLTALKISAANKNWHFTSPTEEMEFLPAALEVVETPPSPIGRATAWCIIALVLFLVGWSTLGKTDVVAVADGKIIPSGRVKLIQPLESGIVTKINVQEGQFVNAGDVLVELDTTVNGADVKRLRRQLDAALLAEARLESLLAWQPESKELPRFVAPEGINDTEVEQEERYLHQDAKALLAKINSYESELIRSQARMQVSAHTMEKFRQQLPIVSKRASARKILYKQGVAPESEWLEAESIRIEVMQSLKAEEQNLAEAEASIDIAQEQRLQALSEYRRDLLEKKTKVSLDVSSLGQELKKAKYNRLLQRISSPVAGKVMRLAVHTIGGVVTPAQELMIIVPEEY